MQKLRVVLWIGGDGGFNECLGERESLVGIERQGLGENILCSLCQKGILSETARLRLVKYAVSYFPLAVMISNPVAASRRRAAALAGWGSVIR
jgi:hypothetical protein